MGTPTWDAIVTATSITPYIIDAAGNSYFSYSLRDTDNNKLYPASEYSTATSITYTGLSPGTTYRVVVSWAVTSTPEGNWDDKYFTTTSIEPWDWNISNGQASAALTQLAYIAVLNNGEISDFSYLVWNDLVNKVNEAAIANNTEWNTKYATYSTTLMTATDKTLTATRFNSLRYNVGLHVSTGITDRYTGDDVLGSYFITITDCLNNWITSI